MRRMVSKIINLFRAVVIKKEIVEEKERIKDNEQITPAEVCQEKLNQRAAYCGKWENNLTRMKYDTEYRIQHCEDQIESLTKEKACLEGRLKTVEQQLSGALPRLLENLQDYKQEITNAESEDSKRRALALTSKHEEIRKLAESYKEK